MDFSSELTPSQSLKTDSIESIVAAFESGQYAVALTAAQSRLYDVRDLPRSRKQLHLLIALSLANLGRREEAVASFELALQIYPLDTDLLYNFAVILSEHGNFDRARVVYQACLRVAPNHLDALWNAGELFRVNQNFGVAYSYLKRFEASGVKRFALSHRLAVCCAYLGLRDDARTYFEKAQLEDPNPVTTWECALYELSRKNYEAGWGFYRDRFLASQNNNVYCENFGLPEWQGDIEQLRDKHLLVLPEQGLGDQVQFAAALEALAVKVKSVNGRVILVARDALFALFQESFKEIGVEVYPHDFGRNSFNIVAQHPGAMQMAMGDLPLYAHYFKPEPRKYLKVPQAAKAQAEGWLAALPQRGQADDVRFRVGIAWGTSQDKPSLARMRRNVSLAAFLVLAEIPEFVSGELQFVSLMVGETAQEIGSLPELDVIDFSGQLKDYADTAGLMACCDLILTPCTSIAHVAAALGKRVILLLQQAGDWRWGTDQTQSDWYPHVDILRQTQPGDWLTPMSQARDLIQVAVQGGTQ